MLATAQTKNGFLRARLSNQTRHLFETVSKRGYLIRQSSARGFSVLVGVNCLCTHFAPGVLSTGRATKEMVCMRSSNKMVFSRYHLNGLMIECGDSVYIV